MSTELLFFYSVLFGKFFKTMLAYIFAFEFGNTVGASAEDAGGFVFFEHNRIFIDVYFKGILFLNIEGSAKLYRQNNSSEFIDFSDNTG